MPGSGSILATVLVLPGLCVGVLWAGSPACWEEPVRELLFSLLEVWQFPGSRRERRKPRRSSSGRPRLGGAPRRRLSKHKLARRLGRLGVGALPKSVPVLGQKTSLPRTRNRSRNPSCVLKAVPLWALEEVQGAAFGDARLNQRLPRLVGQLAADPTAASFIVLPEASLPNRMSDVSPCGDASL